MLRRTTRCDGRWQQRQKGSSGGVCSGRTPSEGELAAPGSRPREPTPAGGCPTAAAAPAAALTAPCPASPGSCRWRPLTRLSAWGAKQWSPMQWGPPPSMWRQGRATWRPYRSLCGWGAAHKVQAACAACASMCAPHAALPCRCSLLPCPVQHLCMMLLPLTACSSCAAAYSCSFSVVDRDGCTPLYCAAAWNRVEAVRLLERLHCPSSLRSLEGRTAVHVAAEQGWVDLIDVLIRELGNQVRLLSVQVLWLEPGPCRLANPGQPRPRLPISLQSCPRRRALPPAVAAAVAHPPPPLPPQPIPLRRRWMLGTTTSSRRCTRRPTAATWPPSAAWRP